MRFSEIYEREQLMLGIRNCDQGFESLDPLTGIIGSTENP